MSFQLHRDEWGKLILTDAQGVVHVGVTPVRVFPFSEPQRWVSLCDDQGKELALVENPQDLPPEVRDMLAGELAEREFAPIIKRILRTSSHTEPCEWDVETDHGPTRLLLKSAEDLHRLGPNRVLVVDSHGVRYLIDDVRNLDASSRRIVEWHM
jgi:hypothetical protein